VTVRLRPLDDADLRAYLQELRPRFLTLRIRAGRVRFGWLVPSWALEEPLRFGLRIGALALACAPDALGRALDRLGVDVARIGGPVGAAAGADRGATPRWWPALDELFSERGRDLLALPDGVPLLDVAAGDAHIVIAEARP
jgi:hypothetical protein